MISLSHLLIMLLLSTPLFLFFLHKWRRGHAPTSGKTPPPSPPRLPVVGNLHQLGSFPHRSLRSLSRRYGPLMLLHFGGKPIVVASSAEVAREIMKTQDLTFASRPRMSIPGRLFYNYKDVAFSPYGEYWRRMRSICVVQLLCNKRLQSYRRVREEETSLMVEKILKLSSSSMAVNLRDVLMSLTNDVICRVALGRKYGGERDFKENFAEFGELIERVAKAFDEFLETVIQEHRITEERERVMEMVKGWIL